MTVLETIPYWQLFLFKVQVLLVYFFGGVAKINVDWLHGQPMGNWMKGMSFGSALGPYLATKSAALFVSYGALFLDLFVGFMLICHGI